METKPVLVVTVGLPRSGKSTWARKLSCPIVNPDSIRLALHGQRFVMEAEPFVWAIAKVMVKALFKAGHIRVVLDATNTTKERRKQWISDEWYTMFHEMNVSKEECISRAKCQLDEEIIPVIEKMASQFKCLCSEELGSTAEVHLV